jgi:hypothetical protein
MVRGDPRDRYNILRWDRVKLNLLGSTNYKPSKPWVSKERSKDEKIACDFIIYVDDIRTSGNDWLECHLTSRYVASHMNWLGLQDAARKHQESTTTPGPWAGLVMQSDGGAITISVGQERWEKASP